MIKTQIGSCPVLNRTPPTIQIQTEIRAGQTIRPILNTFFCLVAVLGITACATTAPAPVTEPTPLPPEIITAPPATPEPTTQPTPPPPVEIPTPSQPAPEPEPGPIPLPLPNSAFASLPYWQNADPTPALIALQKTCAVWKFRPDDKWLNPALPKFGRYKDWRTACRAASVLQVNRANATGFFQTHFEPVYLGADTGLLTGYYAPEIPVRRLASLEFSEPILAKPDDPRIQALPRKDLSVTSATVLAYGRAVDVFFLQIQGSGQIRFQDGTIYRAAFAGHNSKPYTSIGRVLIERGEMTKDQASKQSIEAWMAQAGYRKSKALMAENARYVFFKTEHIIEGEGPKGAMGIPLTSMGSLAVDPKHTPYGAIIWLEGKFPSQGGDYIGADTGHLLVAQDTGGAIKGIKRGDVFFGSGHAAGEKAGVMKHRAKWTLLLPTALALKLSPTS